MSNDMATVCNSINNAFKEFSKSLGDLEFVAQPSRLDKIVDGSYYKTRRLGYLIAIIPLSLIKGIWHGIKDAWESFEYDN